MPRKWLLTDACRMNGATWRARARLANETGPRVLFEIPRNPGNEFWFRATLFLTIILREKVVKLFLSNSIKKNTRGPWGTTEKNITHVGGRV